MVIFYKLPFVDVLKLTQHLSTWRKYLLYLIQDLNTDTRLIEIQQFGIFVRALLCSQPSPTFCAGCRLFRGIGHILWCLSGAELDRNPKNIQLDSSIVSAGSFHVRAICRCRIREVITLSIGLTATDGNMQQHLNRYPLIQLLSGAAGAVRYGSPIIGSRQNWDTSFKNPSLALVLLNTPSCAPWTTKINIYRRNFLHLLYIKFIEHYVQACAKAASGMLLQF